MSKLRVLIYARCSTGKQEHSVQNQLSILEDYCRARQFEIKYTLFDEGYTGRNDKRPALQELMSLVHKRKVDAVIVLKMDRLFRSLKHLVNSLDLFNQLGVKFISVNDQIDMTTAVGRLMANVIGSMSEFESELVKERTVQGLQAAKKRGVKLGRPSLGIDQLILELRSKGFTYKQIQEELNCSKGAVCRAIKYGTPKTEENHEKNR